MGSIAGVIGGFTTFTLFRACFVPRFSLALARCFLGVARTTVRLGANGEAFTGFVRLPGRRARSLIYDLA